MEKTISALMKQKSTLDQEFKKIMEISTEKKIRPFERGRITNFASSPSVRATDVTTLWNPIRNGIPA